MAMVKFTRRGSALSPTRLALVVATPKRLRKALSRAQRLQFKFLAKLSTAIMPLQSLYSLLSLRAHHLSDGKLMFGIPGFQGPDVVCDVILKAS